LKKYLLTTSCLLRIAINEKLPYKISIPGVRQYSNLKYTVLTSTRFEMPKKLIEFVIS